MATLTTFLEALIAIPKIGAYIEEAVQAICAWYLAKQKGETLDSIIDAAAKSARATTDEERYQAAALWQAALSRPRTSL